MGSDWDYINEHLGGHDGDGLPNFMSEPGFADDSYEVKDPDYFPTFQDAMAWAKINPGPGYGEVNEPGFKQYFYNDRAEHEQKIAYREVEREIARIMNDVLENMIFHLDVDPDILHPDTLRANAKKTLTSYDYVDSMWGKATNGL